MGKQLDSFCDLVSFCAAPAVMIYCAGFDTVVDQLALAIFVCSGVARLSRFNIAAHLVPKSDQGKAMYHEGLPTAYAALLASTAVAVAEWTGYLRNLASGSHYPVIIIVLIFSAAMVSKRLHLYIDGAYSIPANSFCSQISAIMSLRPYLEAAYKEVRLSTEVALSPLQHLNCHLKKGQDNLILVYGGSFNPPHRGHLDVLLSALHPVVNAVAMVVLPSEDFHLRHKLANSHPEFFMSRKTRAALWAEMPQVPKDKVWIWSETWYPFFTFMEAAQRFCEADGYKIVFSHLIGPDNLNRADALDNLPYRLPRILVTNKARHVTSQFLPNGQPTKWKGFGEWSPQTVTCDGQEGQPEEVAEEATLWSCRGIDSLGQRTMGYYLDFANRPTGSDINSTAMRRDLLERHSLNEEILGQLSTADLLSILEPVLGITGQDGSYLSELLLEKGYQVHGLVRSTASRREALSKPLRPGLTIHLGDMSDLGRLVQILGGIKPDEIYHLAAQSHVAVSFDTPLQTSDTNAMGTLRLLEAMRMLGLDKSTKFYNACSSEVFGSDMPAPQTEETSFHPVSPYAVTKLFQYWTTVNFREAYGFHASNGILFNHESPRRGTTFVTRKITTQVALIACGKLEFFSLGNLDAVRDWGHAKDYMQGVYLMLQQPVGGDYVLSSGKSYSVRDFVEAAFKVIGVNIEWSGTGLDEVGIDTVSGKTRVKVNPEFYRPLDNQNLLGSATKAKKVLGWKPTYSFEALVEEMVLCDVEAVDTGRIFSNSYLDWVVGKAENGNGDLGRSVSKAQESVGDAHSVATNSDGPEKISLADVEGLDGEVTTQG
ncbi:hypothetical protein LZL87_012705 [Fusarium oxysporum]|nr:hypothetical protein LZL87_012705 [Fusarium oxysporum]